MTNIERKTRNMFEVSTSEIADYMKIAAQFCPPNPYAKESFLPLAIREWEIGRTIHAAKQLYAYLRARAKAERVPFDLDEGFIIKMVLAGVYDFFGATLHDEGVWFCLTDEHEPSKGFLRRWLRKNVGTPPTFEDFGRVGAAKSIN